MENNIILYQTEKGNVNINVKYENENFWLSQKLIAQLFGCTADNVSLHLKNIFNSDELDPESVTEEFSATAKDGKNYKTKFYNLDAIIAAGYRVNSEQATQFRMWKAIVWIFCQMRESFHMSKQLKKHTTNTNNSELIRIKNTFRI